MLAKKTYPQLVCIASLMLVGCEAVGGNTSRKEPSCTDQSSFFDEVFALTNAERQKAGLSLLTLSTELIQAAQIHSIDMATNDYFDHDGLNGSTPAGRARDAGYGSSFVGENIAAGYSSPEDVVAGWMDSPGHRENILRPSYSEIGIGFAFGSGSKYGNYWTQVFGDRPDDVKTLAPSSAVPPLFSDTCSIAKNNETNVKGWYSENVETDLFESSDTSLNLLLEESQKSHTAVVPIDNDIPTPSNLLGWLILFTTKLLTKKSCAQSKCD